MIAAPGDPQIGENGRRQVVRKHSLTGFIIRFGRRPPESLLGRQTLSFRLVNDRCMSSTVTGSPGSKSK